MILKSHLENTDIITSNTHKLSFQFTTSMLRGG